MSEAWQERGTGRLSAFTIKSLSHDLMNSIYQEIQPKSALLKPLIKLYYVHYSSAEDAVEKITYFPNYVTTINVYENSKISWDALSRTHEREVNDKYLKLLVGKFDQSREIIMKGPFNKLTIVFNPLGLNHFLVKPLSKIVSDHFSFFECFEKEFDDVINRVFSASDLETKRDILDHFLENKLIGFQEERLTIAIRKIFDSEGQIPIQQIANELQISRRTLLRIFKTHVTYTPTEYKSIVKFRNALNIYQKKPTKPSLSALSYRANFYDQSDLNAHFKAKTGMSPKQLFSAIESIKQELHWKIEQLPMTKAGR